MKRAYIIFVLVVSAAGLCRSGEAAAGDRDVLMVPAERAPEGEMRIGYFHGGRIHMLYRIWVEDGYAKGGVKVGLYSEFLNDYQGLNRKGFFRVPEKIGEMEAVCGPPDIFGRVTGLKIITAMEKGLLDGGTVGESSFLDAAARGSSITAVAILGHDTRDRPGKGIVTAYNLDLKRAEDFRGKVLITRRAGAGDGIFAREFVRSLGLVPDEDVLIIEQVKDDMLAKMLWSGLADIHYGHLHSVRNMISSRIARLYGKMDWVNPELSHALLVFNNDYIAKNPEKIKKLLRIYAARIDLEKKMPENARNEEALFGLQMAMDYEGMNLPQFDSPPYVRRELLDEMQDLMVRYGHFKKKADLGKFIDSTLLREALSGPDGY